MCTRSRWSQDTLNVCFTECALYNEGHVFHCHVFGHQLWASETTPLSESSILEIHSVVSQAPMRSVGGLVKPVCRTNKTIQKACHSDGCVTEMASSSFLDDDYANSNLNLGDQRWLALLTFLTRFSNKYNSLWYQTNSPTNPDYSLLPQTQVDR